MISLRLFSIMTGVLLVLPQLNAQLVPINSLGLRVARNFKVTLFADSNLADDIYALTFDSQGRVVVTSQGYIKTLHDQNGDGRADAASLFATTATGGMGLCFDKNDLYFVGDGFLSIYRDNDGNGQADGPPEHLLPLRFAEHGGHSIRKGADGWWYVIGGNDSGFNARQHINLASSPIKNPIAGCMLRIHPGGRHWEIIAHGFRNPYDFDFNWLGDVFTYDSDVESDLFLPWYTPTRLYHAGYGGHHSWQLEGWKRSWNRPSYYFDSVDMLAPVGRGSPTGVVCYRHFSFPNRFRDGLFFLDWSFGKVFFLPLQSNRSSYQGRFEIFLESTGIQGFAPTDAAVAPDGSLFISVGGRKTRGGVYKVEYVGRESSTNILTDLLPWVSPELDSVLRAPQPLDAWSRAYWEPTAFTLGPDAFVRAVSDRGLPTFLRVRAIEILTEIFGGLSTVQAREFASDPLPEIRAIVAWSLGRVPCENFGEILAGQALDRDPFVRRRALEAVLDQLNQFQPGRILQLLQGNLWHEDKRVRQTAAYIAQFLPEASWAELWKAAKRALAPARLTIGFAALGRESSEPLRLEVMESALNVLRSTTDSRLRLDAIRLIMLSLGDWNLHQPSVEVYTAYELAQPPPINEGFRSNLLAALRSILPASVPSLDQEATRMLAMFQDSDPRAVDKIMNFFHDKSSPTSDFHFLTVISRLAPPTNRLQPERIAHALLNLDRKLEGQQQRNKQNWTLRLVEVTTNLLSKDLRLADAMIAHPNFPRPNHAPLALTLPQNRKAQAAQLFLTAAKRDPRFVWSADLIELFSVLPPSDVRPVLREQWTNLAFRELILPLLAAKPEGADREKFVAGLSSPNLATAQASLVALEQLPGDESPKNLGAVLQFLQRLWAFPEQEALRTQVILLMEKRTGQPLAVKEKGNDPSALEQTYRPVLEWFTGRYPQIAEELKPKTPASSENWDKILSKVPWNAGSPGRGQVLFHERGCQTCHSGNTPLGPDLAGAARRFSAKDLFQAIIFPSQEIAPLYRSSIFQTRDGRVHTGLVAFESADGIMLLTGTSSSIRLSDKDIISREESNVSLMPEGLLSGLSQQQLADLYSYLIGLDRKM